MRLTETEYAELVAKGTVKVKSETKRDGGHTARRILAALDSSPISPETNVQGKESGKKRSKYGNHKVVDGDLTFDSKKEHAHWLYLKSELQAGRIAKLELQPEFPVTIKGQHICKYIADFRVTYPDGRREVIDIKSAITRKHPVYRLKKKMVEAYYLIKIREI